MSASPFDVTNVRADNAVRAPARAEEQAKAAWTPLSGKRSMSLQCLVNSNPSIRKGVKTGNTTSGEIRLRS